MNSRDEKARAKLGPQQQEILLWLGRRYGLEALAKNQPRYARLRVDSPDFELMDDALNYIKACREAQKKAAAYDRSGNADPVKRKAVAQGRIDVPWTAERFLGHAPTRAESSAVSASLSKLKKRGLIYLTDGTRGEGAKRRVRFVRLTNLGVEVCKSIFGKLARDEYEFHLSSTYSFPGLEND